MSRSRERFFLENKIYIKALIKNAFRSEKLTEL